MLKSRQTITELGASASRSEFAKKVLDTERRFIDDLMTLSCVLQGTKTHLLPFISEITMQKCPPVEKRAGGHRCYIGTLGEVPLLLVIYRNAFEFLALRIGSVRSHGAHFAIGRHDNFPGDSSLPIFLDC